MPRKTNTVVCDECQSVFNTSSTKFTLCKPCRTATSDTELFNSFIKSSFGQWFIQRLTSSGTLKVNPMTVDSITELYKLWSRSRKYKQLSYDDTTKEWNQVLELELAHLFPIAGGHNRIGELTARNLAIVPKSFNRRLSNKVHDVGHYIVATPLELTLKRTKQLLQKYHYSTLVKVNRQLRLKPKQKDGELKSFQTTNKYYNYFDVASAESSRLGIHVFSTDANYIFDIILRGAIDMAEPTKGYYVDTTLKSEGCCHEWWWQHHKFDKWDAEQRTLYVNTYLAEPDSPFVTFRGHNLRLATIHKLLDRGMLLPQLANVYGINLEADSIDEDSETYKTVMDAYDIITSAVTGMQPWKYVASDFRIAETHKPKSCDSDW